METLLANLPNIFCYWSGMLLAWSLLASFGLVKIIQYIHQARKTIRTADVVSLVFVILGFISLTTSLFIIPKTTTLFMDVMLGVNLWHTLFLTYVTQTSLKLWPSASSISLKEIL